MCMGAVISACENALSSQLPRCAVATSTLRIVEANLDAIRIGGGQKRRQRSGMLIADLYFRTHLFHWSRDRDPIQLSGMRTIGQQFPITPYRHTPAGGIGRDHIERFAR